MNDLQLTGRIIRQGQPLLRAVEALETIEPDGPIERVIVWLLLQPYRRQLRAGTLRLSEVPRRLARSRLWELSKEVSHERAVRSPGRLDCADRP